MAQYYSEKFMTIPCRAGSGISEFYLEIKKTHEEEHNATNFKQNPIRYGNSERPQCGRRVKIVARKDIEPTVALPESVQPLNTDVAEKTNDFMSRVASCLNIKRGSQHINKEEKDSLTRSCNWG
uniref:Uncharacterized protein n=1 Tax=Oryza glumipatula TaxID=40148 RepID=A0A0E0AIW6_9ORYZ